MSALSVALQMALGIVLPLVIVRRDQKRLPDSALARTWSDASLWAAVVAFGPLCLPVHFTKARRSFAGFFLGIAWMIGAFAIIFSVDAVLSGIP